MDRIKTGSRLGGLIATLALVAGSLALLAPASASADDSTFNCDALALRASLLQITPVVLGTANAGAATCSNVDGTVISIPPNLGLPINGGILVAKTGVTPDGQTASSAAALAGVGVGLGGSVLSSITGPISQQLTGSASPIPLSDSLVASLLATLGLGPSTPTITSGDLAGGLQQILNTLLSNVLNGSIAGVGATAASASTTCVNGSPVLKGTSQITGLSVLGTNLPLDAVTNQALNLLNTSQLQNLNLTTTLQQLVANLETALGVTTLLQNNPGLINTVNQLTNELLALAGNLVQPVLTSLLAAAQPLIDSIVKITVEPNKQVVANGQLTQTALHLNVTLLGQPLLDLVLGRARVSNNSVNCVPSERLCTTRKLVLLDVFQQGSRTLIAGAAADKKFVGRTIPIYFDPTGNGGRVVAHAKVASNGMFQTTAPLPPIGIRFTNAARYYAKDLGETSLRLKFFRRMHVTTLTSSGGKVHISGTLAAPLTAPVSKIVIQRRISCTKTVNVLTIAGTSSGRFSATLDAPPSGQVGVYRAMSYVRQNPRSRKPFPTFTLPRYVDIP